MKIFLVLATVVWSGSLCFAQHFYPLGGCIKTERLDEPYEQKFTAIILFEKGDKVPDSVLFQFNHIIGGVKAFTIFVDSPSISYLCDSTKLVEYNITETNLWGIQFSTLSAEIMVSLDSNYIDSSSNTGLTSPFSLQYLFIQMPFPVITREAPSYHIRKIFQNPQEDMRLNLMQDLDFRDTIVFLFVNKDYPDTVLKMNSITGDVLLHAPISNGRYGYHLWTQSQSNYYASQSHPQFTVIVNDSIKSRFYYDTTFHDDQGFIRLPSFYNETTSFNFSFSDQTADTIQTELFSSMRQFYAGIPGWDAEPPTVKITGTHDSISVNFSLFTGNGIYEHLPASFNFIVTSQKAGKDCVQRCFSFYVDHELQNSLKEIQTGSHLLSVFPNPAQEQLILKLKMPIGESEINISDISGRIVLKQNLNAKSIDTVSLNVVDLHAGIYFLALKDKLGGVALTKFVKQ